MVNETNRTQKAAGSLSGQKLGFGSLRVIC